MTSLALLLLLAPPLAREPLGTGDWERLEDPVQRRVASLLAGEPVFVGRAAVVPLYARVPSEAGEGTPRNVGWADGRLLARFLVEDGRSYVRVLNPSPEPLLVVAGTVFADSGVEVAVARDAIVPAGFAALVPAAPLRADEPGAGLVRAGLLPPVETGSLLFGLASFDQAVASVRRIRQEDRFVPLLGNANALSRLNAIASVSKEDFEGAGGTAVGVVLVVGDEPIGAHVFARHDLFLDALPDLLKGLAIAARDDEIENGRPAPGRPGPGAYDVRCRAAGWLRAVAGARGTWSESYGAGFEMIAVGAGRRAIGHAVVDQQRGLVHAGFFAVVPAPVATPSAGPAPPDPPGTPDETPTGFRERRSRPTVEDARRAGLNPNPGPNGSPGGGAAGGGGAGRPR